MGGDSMVAARKALHAVMKELTDANLGGTEMNSALISTFLISNELQPTIDAPKNTCHCEADRQGRTRLSRVFSMPHLDCGFR